MSLTVTEANHVARLLRWLADKPAHNHRVTDAEAIEAMELLADHAGRTLQMSPDRELPARIVERLRAADSDGAAQAVCQALAVNGWAGRRETVAAFDEWRRLQDTALGERLRDQTAGSIDTAWGVVDA